MKRNQAGAEDSVAHRQSAAGPTANPYSSWDGLAREIGQSLSPELTARLRAYQDECENYRELFENARDAIYTHDLKGRYLSANKAAEELVGHSRHEILGRPMTDFIPAEYLGDVRRRMRQKLNRPQTTAYELEVFGRGGRRIPVEISSRLIYEAGVPVGVQGIARDITARRRMEVEREALFEIIQGVSSSANLDDLLHLIHQSIGRVLSAENCFVALHDEGNATLSMRFFVDKYDSIPAPQKIGKSCAAHVFRTAKPLLITQDVFDQLAAAGKVELVGKPSPSWLGVPLNTPAKTIGVLVVQHYEDARAYGEGDLKFLASVGGQIAVAIERKQGEAALRASEERYRELFEGSVMGASITTVAGKVLACNAEFARIFGFASAAEVMESKAVSLYQQPGDRDRFIDLVRRERRLENYEAELRRADGTTIFVAENVTGVFDEWGELVELHSHLLDITERKHAEVEVNRLVAAVEQTADSVVITDIAGNIQYVNPAFERITGYSKQEVMGRNPRLLKSGKTAASVYRDLWETVRRGDIWVGQLVNKRKDGTLFEEHVTISPVRDNSGRIANYIAVKHDTTLQTQLEAQLRQSQKLEAVGQLAGGVAHDFNNMLTVISGYTDLSLTRLGQADPIRGHLEEVKKASDRAASLTRQLLAFSRKQILEPKVLDLNAAVNDLYQMLRRLIGEHVVLITVLAPDLSRVKADPGQLDQMLMNLVVNARDAMPQGGKVTIETSNVFLDDEYAQQHFPIHPGGYVMLAISDTGAGMAPDVQARIFEPFFTTKEIGQGTGLGLSTVYGIVKQSGGFIWVYSELDLGTTFKVYLPRLTEDAEPEQSDIFQPAIPGGTGTILLVEDDAEVRTITARFLELAGFKVLESEDGYAALAIVRSYPEEIQLVLTDVVMPSMSGRELAAHLAELRPGTPVLFMSGYTDDAIVRYGIMEQGTAFLQKPFTLESLVRRVAEVLQAKERNRHRGDA